MADLKIKTGRKAIMLRNGAFLEIKPFTTSHLVKYIGYYNPMVEPADVKVDSDKAKKWISNGAQMTDTVKALFTKYNVLGE